MTEEHQELMRSIIKTIAEEFGANVTFVTSTDRTTEHQRIVIEYGRQEKQRHSD
tara:strand:- start:196 stop:357 length:162 start_codon:yes stop_codon:yes gene_type:complete